MNIGKGIKEARRRVGGWTQVDLALESGISQTSISQIENGHKQPSKRTIKQMCKTIKVPEGIVYILGLEASDLVFKNLRVFADIHPIINELRIKLDNDKQS